MNISVRGTNQKVSNLILQPVDFGQITTMYTNSPERKCCRRSFNPVSRESGDLYQHRKQIRIIHLARM